MDRSGLLTRAAAVAQVLVADLDVLGVSREDYEHLARVLRVRRGEHVAAVDGQGSWRSCRWVAEPMERRGRSTAASSASGPKKPAAVGPGADRGTDDDVEAGAPMVGVLEADGDVASEPPSTPLITVGFSIPKGDRPEWIVQKLTEQGVDRIVPFISERTVVRWDERKAERHLERFRRIAYEAAMQSRRVWLPRVESVADLATLDLASASLAHPGGDEVSLERPCVFVGPEGGWAPEELVRSQSVVDLGPTVLRAETAAVTVSAVLCALRAKSSDFVQSVPRSAEADRVRD